MIMEAFFIYILKVAVLTAAFGILYHYLLKKETFHRFNRMVLAASLLLAYILPFFVISVSWSGRKLAEDEYQKYSNTQGYEWFSGPTQPSQIDYTTASVQSQANPVETAAPQELNVPAVEYQEEGQRNWVLLILGIVYTAGVIFILVTRFESIINVRRIIRNGRSIENNGKWNIIVSESDIQPFNWMKDIVLPDDPTVLNDPVIVEHEKAHIAFGHSYELLIFDIITFPQWFNPAIWMMRRDLCAVHEFQVDADVIGKGYDRKGYQYSLLYHAVGLKAIAIACGFRLNSLQDRIKMMNRPASSARRIARIIYVPLIALVAILLWARKTDYVDMGTGVLWATCNLGADSPDELGDYYAWGETEAKDLYSLDNYAWKDSSARIPLEPRFDAATKKLGKKWRIPTHVEWEELLNSCDRSWVSMNGTKGLLLKSRSNGNTLFLPAADCHLEDKDLSNTVGAYWTNTAVDEIVVGINQKNWNGTMQWCSNAMSRLRESRREKALPDDKATMVIFDSINLTMASDYRYAGLSIRPVKAGYKRVTKKGNLEFMSRKKRDRKLTKIASDAILEVGSDYYREDTVPVITGPFTFSWKETGGQMYIEQEGRRYFLVTYPYDNEKEEVKIAQPFTAQVLIWADNGEIGHINFGNGLGFNFFTDNTYEHAITENVYPNLDYDKPAKSKIHMPFQYQQYHSGRISGENKDLFNAPFTYITGTIKDVEGNPVQDAVVMVVDTTGQQVALGTSNTIGQFVVIKNDILRDSTQEFSMRVFYSAILCQEQKIHGNFYEITLEE